MSTNSYWCGKKNNATAKIVRAYFGLPVEPLTVINIENAGMNTDDPRMDVERFIPDLQSVLAAPRSLEWLVTRIQRPRKLPSSARHVLPSIGQLLHATLKEKR